MANLNAPFGLRYVRNIQGNYNSSGQSRYRITTAAATNSTKIYQGDLVTQNTAGIITRVARADSGSATSALILGVFNGCFYTDPVTSKPTFANYWPGNAAKDGMAFIFDHPMDVFEIQSDAAMALTGLFGNYDIVDSTGPSASVGNDDSGNSHMQLDVSTIATTATLPLKCLDISEDPERSDVSSANTNVLVTIQNHLFGAKAAGLA